MPSPHRVSFKGASGEQLAGKLVLPSGEPRAWALFAHCFTCGKDLAAARRISESLAQGGIGVLRFDFTGLGESEGEFADTNFSTNVADLVAAAAWLEQEHGAPALLVGHSLGGAAVLAATPAPGLALLTGLLSWVAATWPPARPNTRRVLQLLSSLSLWR